MTWLKSDSDNDSEQNIIAHKCVKIYKNYVNLWVINGVLTIKNVFTTIRVVWVTAGMGLKRQNGQFKVF